MMGRSIAFVRSLCVGAVIGIVSAAVAGPLSPPAGPVAPTGKTTDQLWAKIASTDQGVAEPRTPISAETTPGDALWLYIINQPGSYYLTGNVQGVAGKGGIFIAADGVTVDLMGFQMTGAGSGLAIGTFTQTNFRRHIVRNGVITNWGDGVVVGGNSVIADLVVTSCGKGLHCAGQESRVERCTVVSCSGYGLRASGGGMARNCYFSRNGGTGLSGAGTWIVEGCRVDLNDDGGIEVGDFSVVRGCQVAGNTGDGISVENYALVMNNTCTYNTNGTASAAGIRLRGTGARAEGNVCASNYQGIMVAGSGNRIEGNSAVGNTRGYTIAGTGNFVARNTASGSTTVNWDVGNGNIIFVVQAAVANGMFGNSGGLSPGSTNPNANYTH